MGKPKFQRKKYDGPLHPWKETRIKSERDLMKKYGLKNHREVWKAKTLLRKYRRQARVLLGKIGGLDPQTKRESDQLLLHLTRMSILPDNSDLDDVLALDTEIILSRRLQTLVYHRGFANTVDHARQLVSHGHIAIGNKKVTIPGYIVEKNEENQIAYTAKSPLNAMSHPARPKTEVQKTIVAPQPVPVSKEPVKPAEPKKEPAPAPAEPALPPVEKKPELPTPEQPAATPEVKEEKPVKDKEAKKHQEPKKKEQKENKGAE